MSRPTGRIQISAAAFVVLLFAVPASAAAMFLPGDIFLNNFNGNNIQQYSSAGVLKQTFTGTGTKWEGAALAPVGNLITSYRSNGGSGAGINVFNQSGTQIFTFSTPQTEIPGGVSVFPDGNIAMSDQQFGDVLIYNPTGTLVRTIDLPAGSDPFGNTLSPDGTLWIASNVTQSIYQVSESGSLLQTISLSFWPSDLVVAPDRSLYVAADSAHEGTRSEVEHLSSTGSVLGTFSTVASEGIAMAPNGTLWLSGQNSNDLLNYSTSGSLLGSIAISGPDNPLFLNIEPIPAPEPGTLAMAGLGAIIVLALGWRRKAGTTRGCSPSVA